MPHSLAKNSRYKKFVRARNKALEKFHLQALLHISSVMHDMVRNIRDRASTGYPDILRYGVYSQQGRQRLQQLQIDLQRMFDMVTPHIVQEMQKLRRMTYVLSYAGEAEAIGQATGNATRYSLTTDKLNAKKSEDTFTGGSILDRVQHINNKMLRKIMNTIELAAVQKLDPNVMLTRLDYTLPKQRKVSTNQRNITVGKISEANRKDDDEDPTPDMSSGYVDEATWDEMVAAYKDDRLPSFRGDDVAYTYADKTGERETAYAWEVEQELTQDFVYQVRQGSVDAAKENGINDYQWIAIIDSHTDDCCEWRDGLTTAEIEKELKGSHSDDECDAVVPPAHFNCRCELAPMVEEMPEDVESNEKEFDEWLNN